MFGSPLKLTLSQFVKVIEALTFNNTIRHHFTYSILESNTVQLPFKVTCAFKKLDKALHDPSWQHHVTPPREYFDEFLLHLVTAARANWHNPHVQHNHAEFLLGFLLHANLIVELDEENAKNIKDLVFSKFPASEARFILWGTPPFGLLYIPAEGYDFLSEVWQEAQHYPTIEELKACLLKKEDEDKKAQLLLQKEKEKQHQEALEIEKQRQLLEILNRHYFLAPLSLCDFSLLLEALYKTGRVQFPHLNPFIQKHTVVPYSISLKIVQFAYLARQPGYDKEKFRFFLELMKEIISGAKCTHEFREGCLFLLGFLLYHNIHVFDGERLYRIADLYYAEASYVEKQYLHSGRDLLPVSNADWQREQCYPGKDLLEFCLNSTSFVFLPSFRTKETEIAQAETVLKNNVSNHPSRFI